jgi:mannosyl-oligosaccharide alpha-1,3-glucosidase
MVRRERPRRSTRAQTGDPFTLIVALDSDGAARGQFYHDDGHSFLFEDGIYTDADISYTDMTLQYQPRHSGYEGLETFERVVIMGRAHSAPEAAYVAEYVEAGRRVEVMRGNETVGGLSHETLVLRNPQTPVTQSWTLKLRNA